MSARAWGRRRFNGWVRRWFPKTYARKKADGTLARLRATFLGLALCVVACGGVEPFDERQAQCRETVCPGERHFVELAEKTEPNVWRLPSNGDELQIEFPGFETTPLLCVCWCAPAPQPVRFYMAFVDTMPPPPLHAAKDREAWAEWCPEAER